MQNISIPTQEIIFIAMPVFRPATLDMIPMIQGIRMPPKLAAGSMTPILATLVIFPAQATAVGFMPAIYADLCCVLAEDKTCKKPEALIFSSRMRLYHLSIISSMKGLYF